MDVRTYLAHQFSLEGRTAVVIGGSGALGGAIASALAGAGARVAVVGRRLERCQQVTRRITAEGEQAAAFAGDARSREALEEVAENITKTLGPVSILVNSAGGNDPQATTSSELLFFTLAAEHLRAVYEANFTATLLGCQVFGQRMAEHGEGSIINIVSASALRPLTRVVAYGAAKAAVLNLTQWLAVHMATEYSARIRVNALAPGFFLTEQNGYLMTDSETGEWTPRAQTVLAHTPLGRLGVPDALGGAALWLASPAAAFVTGAVVPVDGGFTAFSGV